MSCHSCLVTNLVAIYTRRESHANSLLLFFLQHVACPPKEIVQNAYLEQVMRDSSQALIHVCLEFGATGRVNEATFGELEKELQDNREAS